MEVDAVGGSCSTQGENEKCVQNFNWSAWREYDIKVDLK
jgi:hypothetical protein